MPDQFQYIKLPDGSYGKFRADATDAEIRGHIQNDFPDAFKPASQPSAVSRFASSAADSSGLSMIGNALRHPLDTAGNVAGAVADAVDPNGTVHTVNPNNPITQGVSGMVNNTVDNARQAWKDARSKNPAGAVSHAISAIPVLGPTLDKAEDQYAKGDIAGEMGTLTGAATTFAVPARGAIRAAGGGEALTAAADAVPGSGIVSRIPDAVAQARNKFVQTTHPRNLSLTPEESNAQNFAKALAPPIRAVERIKGAAAEVPAVLDYAQRNDVPINGKLDFAKAAEGAAKEIQSHYDDKLLRPHSGKFQTVPEGYNGELSGNGRNQATLGQINSRVNEINAELKSNFRKSLASETSGAQASDAELNAEKNTLTKILHSKLADMNGLEPEDIANTRQRAGKLRSLAEETKLSGNQDTVAAGRRDGGAARTPVRSALEGIDDSFTGGPEVVGNRILREALQQYTPKYTSLPEPVLPDPSVVPTTPEAAQQEFLRAHQTEQAAQDAAAARNTEAEKLRAQNVATQQQAAQTEAARSIQSEQAAQDAASARNAEAERLRGQNVSKQQDIAKTEATRAVEGEQSAQDAATARNAEAERLRAENVARQKQAAQGEVVRSVQGEQTAQDLAAARAKFAAARRGANVAADQAATDAQAAANRTAAQQEVLKAAELDQAAKDAAASRGATAADARSGNAAADQQQRLAEGAAVRNAGQARAIQTPRGAPAPTPPDVPATIPADQPTIQEKEVVPADAAKGVQPVTLPVEVPAGAPTHPSGKVTAIDQDTGLPIVKRGGGEETTPKEPAKEETADAGPTPDTHVFSKQEWAKQNPEADADEAAAAAQDAGYEVQD